MSLFSRFQNLRRVILYLSEWGSDVDCFVPEFEYIVAVFKFYVRPFAESQISRSLAHALVWYVLHWFWLELLVIGQLWGNNKLPTSITSKTFQKLISLVKNNSLKFRRCLFIFVQDKKEFLGVRFFQLFVANCKLLKIFAQYFRNIFQNVHSYFVSQSLSFFPKFFFHRKCFFPWHWTQNCESEITRRLKWRE